MMAKLTPWKTSDDDRSALQPGRDLDSRLAGIYGANDVNYALGAVLAGEVFGKQLDQFLGDEFRRQRTVDVSTLEWLVLHEQLEVEHADSSAVLELLLPADAAGAAADGADAIARAGWRFLDDLYALCFGH
jgi:hypothetical protein